MWIVLPPSTPSASVPGSEGSTLALSLPQAERLAQSVTLSGKHTRPRFWLAAWKKKPWLRLLSGATCEPSTADHGAASWIASLAATRASRSVSPVADVDSMILATFGRRSLSSLRKSSPASCSSRTSLAISLWDSPTSDESLKAWGIELRRDSLRRRKSARRTSGSGCSSLESENGWATPQTPNGGRIGTRNEPGRQGKERHLENQAAAGDWYTPNTDDCAGKNKGRNLGASVEGWPTPNAADHKTSPDYPHKGGNPTLPMAACHWQTPANPAFSSRRQVGADQREALLPGQAEHRQTPRTARGGYTRDNGNPERERPTLEGQAEWATPRSAGSAGSAGVDYQPGRKPRVNGRPITTTLTDQIKSPSFRPDPETLPAGSDCSSTAQTSRPRLNPAFVEWLMGWPEGWTDFGRAETAWSLWRQRMRLSLSGLVCGRATE